MSQRGTIREEMLVFAEISFPAVLGSFAQTQYFMHSWPMQQEIGLLIKICLCKSIYSKHSEDQKDNNVGPKCM